MEEEVQYEGIVYRPPSEAQSLIIQATIGCAHNTCVFCSMYRGKKFRVRKMEDIKADIVEGARLYGRYVSKVFLADGDALAMTTQDMVEILAFVKQQLPQVTQISSYATAQDLLEKSLDELQLIKDSGLDLLYIGAESGDNQVLHSMAKGVTAEQLAQAERTRTGICPPHFPDAARIPGLSYLDGGRANSLVQIGATGQVSATGAR